MKLKKIALSVVAAGCLFSASAFSQDVPAWVKKIKISGDLSVRTEVISDAKPSSPYDRLRERGRLRLGFDTTPSDKVKVNFGIETSGTNPTSGWVNFNDFENASLYLSHAYIQYAPADSVTLLAGKIKSDVNFWRPVQHVWRNDVNPFGFAANFKATSASKKANFFANFNLYALTADRRIYWYDNENTPADVPIHTVAVVQPGFEYKEGNIGLKGAFGVQQFSLTGHSSVSASGWLKENKSYTLLTPSWEARFSNLVAKYGLTFSGEYSKNVNESADGDTNAYTIQLGFGSDRVSASKDWQIKVARRHREKFAIPAGLGQTDAYDADPGKGWEYVFTVGLIKDLSFNAALFFLTDIDGNKPQKVSKLDLVYKF